MLTSRTGENLKMCGGNDLNFKFWFRLGFLYMQQAFGLNSVDSWLRTLNWWDLRVTLSYHKEANGVRCCFDENKKGLPLLTIPINIYSSIFDKIVIKYKIKNNNNDAAYNYFGTLIWILKVIHTLSHYNRYDSIIIRACEILFNSNQY